MGVELAAEIAGHGHGSSIAKKIILISSKQRLLDQMPEAAGRHAAEWLQKRGVELVLGDKATVSVSEAAEDGEGAHVVTTTAGRRFQVDLVYTCMGMSINTKVWTRSCVHPQSPPQQPGPSSDKSGEQPGHSGSSSGSKVEQQQQQWRCQGIPAESTLQVTGCTNIFACGDCFATPFERTALAADMSAKLVAANIRRLDKGQELLRYPEGVYGSPTPATVTAVSLYKYGGILQVGNRCLITGPIAAVNKWTIELMQILQAQEVPFIASLWSYMEVLTIMAAVNVFR